MNTKPLNEILPLNRDEYIIKIQEHCSNLLNEVIYYGTHFIKSDIKVKRKGKDNHIPTLIFRNVLELSDSISILIVQSSIEPCKILLRSLLENTLSLIYMLEGDERKNALCFMVVKANKEIKYYNKFIKKEKSSEQFRLQVEKDEHNIKLDRFIDHPEFIKAKKAKLRLLDKPEFKAIQQEYLRTSKKIRNPNWYSLFDGPKDLFQLSERLNKTVRYEFFYRKFSESVHGQDILKGLVLSGKNQGQIIQIRNFKDTQLVTFDTISLLLEIFTLFINKRIPYKYKDFEIWYKTIRDDFLDLGKRKYFNYKE